MSSSASREETLDNACYDADIKTAMKLLSKGADVNGQDDPKIDGSTLHSAMAGKNAKIVELLLYCPNLKQDLT